MRTKIFLLFALACLAVTVQDPLPPSPYGLKLPAKPILSPKAAELKASLGTAMVKPKLFIPPNEFRITNATFAAGRLTLSWSSNQPWPYQIVGSASLDSAWGSQGKPTLALNSTFAPQANAFWKVQAQVPIFFLNETNQPRLTWTVPDIDMSDTLGPLTLQKRATEPTAGNGIEPDDNTGWTTVASNIPPTQTSIQETTTPPVWYRLNQPTLLGQRVPYGVKQLTLTQPHSPLRATQLLNTFTGSPPYPGSVALSSATDASGNSYVCGYCRPYGGSFNIFIAKYSASGVQSWNQVFVPGGGDGRAFDIAIDKDGNVIITGFFVGNITFGGPTFNSGTGGSIWLLKLSPTGSYIWSTAFTSNTVGFSGDEAGFGVSTDISGNIYVCGSFTSSPMTVEHSDFSGATGSVALNTTGGQDIVLAKFSSIGSVLWAKKFGSVRTIEKGKSLAVEYSTGKCYLTGAFEDTVDFSQGTGAPLINPNAAKSAIFIASFDTTGASLNSVAFPSTGDGTGIRCVLDLLGSPVISTTFSGNITVGAAVTYSAPNTKDVLIIKLSATLVPVWSLHCLNSSASINNEDIAYGLGVSPNGNIVFCGEFWNKITIGSFVLQTTTGLFDIFVAALDPSTGVPQRANQYGTVGDAKQSQAYQVGFDSAGNMYMPVQNTGIINFSSTVSLGVTLLQSGGLVKFSP